MTFTIKDLKEELEGLDENLPVVCTFTYKEIYTVEAQGTISGSRGKDEPKKLLAFVLVLNEEAEVVPGIPSVEGKLN